MADKTGPRELQLIVLGACMASRKTLDAVSADDFADEEIAIVVEYMKLKASGAEQGSDRLSYWLAQRGVQLNGKSAIETACDWVHGHAIFKRAQKLVCKMSLDKGTFTTHEDYVRRLKEEVGKL